MTAASAAKIKTGHSNDLGAYRKNGSKDQQGQFSYARPEATIPNSIQ